MRTREDLRLLLTLLGCLFAVYFLMSPIAAQEEVHVVFELKPRVLWSADEWNIYAEVQGDAFNTCMQQAEGLACEKDNKDVQDYETQKQQLENLKYNDLYHIRMHYMNEHFYMSAQETKDYDKEIAATQKKYNDQINALQKPAGVDTCRQRAQDLVRGKPATQSPVPVSHSLQAKADRCRMLGQSAHDAIGMAIEKADKDNLLQIGDYWTYASHIYEIAGDTENDELASTRADEYYAAGSKTGFLTSLFEPLPPWVAVAGVLAALFIMRKKGKAGR